MFYSSLLVRSEAKSRKNVPPAGRLQQGALTSRGGEVVVACALFGSSVLAPDAASTYCTGWSNITGAQAYNEILRSIIPGTWYVRTRFSFGSAGTVVYT